METKDEKIEIREENNAHMKHKETITARKDIQELRGGQVKYSVHSNVKFQSITMLWVPQKNSQIAAAYFECAVLMECNEA